MALQEAPVCSPPRPEAADRPRRRVVRKFPLAVPLVDVYPVSPPSPGTSPMPVPSVARALAGRVASLPYALLLLLLHPASR